jgi:TRAP-type C4-dicarboxylate transport system permease small subunit
VAGGALLERVTRFLALVGGTLLLASVVLSIVSITGRYTVSLPVPGDYELVELICAVAVFLFFPYTHSIGGNLTAEFFTSGLPRRWQAALDVVHDAIFALIAALLAWRLGGGMVDKFDNGDSSILLQIPLWWPYTVAVACMWLLCIVSLWRAAAGIGVLRR